MNQETRTCQNCKNQFSIEPEDFLFYEKVKVPPPTWCPECRSLRRVLWRNEAMLYKRPDSRTGKIIFSMFPASSPLKVWEESDWQSDIWEAGEYGRDYEWGKPLLEQFFELMRDIPWPSRSISVGVVGSDYSNNASYIKNCYLVFGTGESEDCYCSDNLVKAKNAFDSAYCGNVELTYETFNSNHCYRAFFSLDCEDCTDIMFCFNCVGSSHCFGCTGLRNKSYYIFNQPYSKEEYQKYLDGLNLGSFKSIEELKKKTKDLWLKQPVKFMHGRHNTNVSGEYIYNSRNVKNCWQVVNGDGLKYCQGLFTGSPRDSYDSFRLFYNNELVYESVVCGHDISKLKFCFECHPACRDLQYCIWCMSCSHLFACIGLRNKHHCILNKQYTKEQYEALLPRIIQHMSDMPYQDRKGRTYTYGEFFPPELSPFAYNETIAQEYFPLTKQQAIEQGYSWKDPEERNYTIDIKSQALPDNIKDVPDDIIGKVIECGHKGTCNEQCTEAFKIIEPELAFYRRMNLPLPRLCPNCRHYQRLKQRNPLKLWKRQC
ncbi:MAG: hypothetical protein PHU56_03695, partial [Candidatus Pacebacteria bacterium]|nr:hypothetical protein [Candidatus Paceibacterota bacterium]